MSESEIDMVRRHIRQGERHVARQREVVAELRAGGRPTELAESLLEEFEATLRDHWAHLARIVEALAEIERSPVIRAGD